MEGMKLRAGGGVAGGKKTTWPSLNQAGFYPNSLRIHMNIIQDHPPQTLCVPESDWLYKLHLGRTEEPIIVVPVLEVIIPGVAPVVDVDVPLLPGVGLLGPLLSQGVVLVQRQPDRCGGVVIIL